MRFLRRRQLGAPRLQLRQLVRRRDPLFAQPLVGPPRQLLDRALLLRLKALVA